MSDSQKSSDDVYRLPSEPQHEYIKTEFNPGDNINRDYKKPRRKNTGSNLSMIVLGAVVLFSFVLGFGLVFLGTKYLPETLKKLTGISDNKEKAEDSGNRKLKVVLTDYDYKLYNSKNNTWDYHQDKTLPLNTYIKTNFASYRNVFTLNDRHSIRAGNNTTFTVESFVSKTNPDGGSPSSAEEVALVGAKDASKIKGGSKTPAPSDEAVIDLTEGDIWVDGCGDRFSVRTSQGTATGKDGPFHVKTLVKEGIVVYSGDGSVDFKMKSDDSIKHMKPNQILMIGSKGNIKTGPFKKDSRWQTWNRKFDTKTMMAGKIPDMPEYQLPSTKSTPGRSASAPYTYRSPKYSGSPTTGSYRTPSYTYTYSTPRYVYRTRRPKRSGSVPTFGGSESYPTATPKSYYSYPTATPRYRSGSTPYYRRTRTPSYYRRTRRTRKTDDPYSYSTPRSSYTRRSTPSPSYYRNRSYSSSSGSNNSSIPEPLRNPSYNGRNPLYNNPSSSRVPGMGINEKPAGPPGGYGVPYYGSTPTPP